MTGIENALIIIYKARYVGDDYEYLEGGYQINDRKWLKDKAGAPYDIIMTCENGWEYSIAYAINNPTDIQEEIDRIIESVKLEENNNTQSNSEDKPQAEQLAIDSEIVQKLYNYILKMNYREELLVYQQNKVTYEDLSNQLKLLTVFENIDESEIEKVDFKDSEKNNVDLGYYYGEGKTCKYLYSKELVETRLKEIFGENATVIHENCSPWDGITRNYENGIYTEYPYPGGGDVEWSGSESILVSAERRGENIYIYDMYFHIIDNGNLTKDIYTTSDRKIQIFDNINLEEEGLYEGTDYSKYTTEENEEIINDNLLEICGNKAKKFKHIFKMDDNNNYFWFSTEIVDE